MAILNFSFDTGSVPLSRINNAIASQYGYQDTINAQPNPETQIQFSRRMIGDLIKNIVKNQEVFTTTKAAVNTVTEITLI